MKFHEMDSTVTLRDQMTSDAGPVVLINKFYVDPGEADALMVAWAADAAVMKRQPGFITTQLHRGIEGSNTFVNYAVWESAAAFHRAFQQPEFQAGLAQYPESAVAEPHLFQRVAVPGICLG
ncbi:MAG: antibiotic biosynthesis monooxygenase [Candidatus Eremiobacteraeota bacterium]|nr:antibiotic biosynthesis monooxygenase [Candidatus Eremiobacteraeota bacterium]